jgi:hypothetical protein
MDGLGRAPLFLPTSLWPPNRSAPLPSPLSPFAPLQQVDIVDEHNQVLRQATRAEMVRVGAIA